MTTLPESLHFVGVGGIGMSGVAQAAAALGIKVTGSDRALGQAENERIFRSLREQGIALYPQDGSVYSENKVGAIVYSTAIEEDNPDFSHAPSGTPRIHRSEAITLELNAMKDKRLHAVAGSCGKTTVSAHLTEALFRLGADPGSLCGGLMNAFRSDRFCGNFRDGKGSAFVIEADESDRSLLNYTPDSAIVLNIGTDHYSREELCEVFAKFLHSVRGPAVLEDRAFLEIGPARLKGVDLTLFSADPAAPAVLDSYPVRKLDSFSVRNGHFLCSFDSLPEFELPSPGHHSAANALAVYSLLRALRYGPEESLSAVRNFSGVWRRFDFAGTTSSGARVYDDYAHNVQKIQSALDTARAMTSGRVFAVFQPHGFAPLRFMRDELLSMLSSTLSARDRFAFLPVYYAGGTASFTPTSEEVASSYRAKMTQPERLAYCPDRTAAEKFLSGAGKGDIVLILGARDNSLSDWAKTIASL